ncbi:MAG: hypothetical protein HRF50_11315 [Phycisphaerae bacterium]|jgi:hypothetical protein
MKTMYTLACLLAGAAAARAQQYDFTTPLYDQWQYPFNFTPGSRPIATCFSSLGTGNPDFAAFNDRDGQLIVAWNTAAQIPSGQGAQNYDVASIRITLTNQSAALWAIDLTPDEWYTFDFNLDGQVNADGVPRGQPGDTDGESDDPDPGRTVELFGVGFGPTYSAATWTEASSYHGGTVLGGTPIWAPRDPFPFVYQDGTGNVLHVEDNVEGLWNSDYGVTQFTPTPWAVGVPQDYDPNNQDVPFEVVFDVDLDLSDGRVREYFRSQLDTGRVFVQVTSLAETEQFGNTDYTPKFFTKEGTTVEPGAKAPILTIVLGAPGLDGDLDGDGCVNLADLSQLLTNYGQTSGAQPEDGDIDGDGDVDLADLSSLLTNYGLGQC